MVHGTSTHSWVHVCIRGRKKSMVDLSEFKNKKTSLILCLSCQLLSKHLFYYFLTYTAGHCALPSVHNADGNGNGIAFKCLFSLIGCFCRPVPKIERGVLFGHVWVKCKSLWLSKYSRGFRDSKHPLAIYGWFWRKAKLF